MDVQFFFDVFPDILEGLSITLSLFLWTLLFSTMLGLVLALMRLSPLALLRWLSAVYGWLIRGIPLLLLLFYVFFALPEFGEFFTLSPFRSAVLGLTLWTASYQSEAIRSGIISVDKGQFEASEALGMTKFHQMRKIILPQSVRIIAPPFTGNAINALKQTSLATVITVSEMTGITRGIIASSFQTVEPLLALALVYLALTTVLVVAQSALERVFRLKT
jgi:polar amino acid transport system permease protein